MGEVLGSLSNVEEQLSREYGQVDHLSLFVAGVVLPADDGCLSLHWSRDGRSAHTTGIRGGHPYRQSYAGYRSWLSSVTEFGIQVVELPTKVALANHLVADYLHHQKPPEEHKTFRVPIRAKQVMKHWPAEILTLMGLCDSATGRTFIGPEAATALLNTKSTVMEILSADCEELASVQMTSGRKIGPVMAKKILAAVGRSEELKKVDAFQITGPLTRGSSAAVGL